MEEGTNVGSIFLDLIVRDTVQKQTERIAAKAQASAKQSFGAVERSAQTMTNQIAAKSQEMGQRIQSSIGGAFNKSVAMAQAKVAQLERELDAATDKLDAMWNSDSFDPDDKATKVLLAQQEKLVMRIKAAQERLAIEEQAVAQKQAAIAEDSTSAQHPDIQPPVPPNPPAPDNSIWKQMVTLSGMIEAKFQKIAEKAKIVGTAFRHPLQAADRILGSIVKKATSFVKIIAKASVRKLVSGVKSLGKHFTSTSKSTSRFGTRLKGIVSSALVFNILSRGLRQMTDYLGSAIGSSKEMQTALANLKGAAATAAAPIIEALTPALTALTNAAATAFSYVSRFASYLTGKSISDMAKAAKAMQKASDTAKRSTASFDEIEKLGDSGSKSSTANYDFQGQSKLLDSALQAILKGRWDQVGQIFADKVNKVVSSLDAIDIGQKIGGFINNLTSTVHGFFTTVDFSGIGQKLGAILTETFKETDWAKVGETAAAVLTALPKTLVGFILETDWAVAAQSLSKTIISAFNGVSDWIKGVDWKAVGDQVATFFKNVDWGGVATSLFEGIGSALGGLSAFLCGLLEEAWGAVVDWWHEVAFEDGGFTMSGLLEGILAGICNIGQWLLDHVVNPFLNGFKEAFGIHSPSTVMAEMGDFLIQGFLGGITKTWEKITKFFGDAFAGLKDLIKGAINGILGFMNGLISGVVGGVNLIVQAMNKLKFDVPDWVPGLGGKTFGFNLAEISAPQIPLLANGGVIRQPTLAMMGEYPGANSNPEIVAPRSMIAETVASVIAGLIESNAQGFEDVVQAIREKDTNVQLDGDVLGSAISSYNSKMAIIRGGYY